MSINLNKIGGRGTRSFLISAIFHLIAVVVGGFFMLSRNPAVQDEFFSIDIFKSTPAKLKHKPAPPKRRLSVKKLSSINRESGSVHKISEVLEQSLHPVIADATLEEHSKNDVIPDVTTIAPKVKSRRRHIKISSAVSTGNKPSPGDGILSSRRQRAGGSGSGKGQGGYGLDLVDSIGVEELDDELLGDTSLSKLPEKEMTPYGEALSMIAEHVAGNSMTGSVDVVFVMDTSMSMQDNVDKVADNLFSMIETYDKYGIIYRLGVVEFSVRQEGEKIDLKPLTTEPVFLQRQMKSLRLSGDEHALDALIQTLTHMNFRPMVDKNLILVTDEPASTSWKVANAYQILRNRIISECQSAQIAVNVLGANRSYQRRLAEETGGLWIEIPGGQREKSTSPSESNAQKATFMKGIRKIAVSISRKVKASQKPVDLVFAVDFSSSMGAKAELVINGVKSIMQVLDYMVSEYRVGMIQFADPQFSKLCYIDGVDVTKMPIRRDSVLAILQSPFGGDEELLDAVFEGLPRMNFRSDSERFLVIITDEPSTGKYTAEQAIEMCQKKSVRVFVVGALPEGIDEKEFNSGTKIHDDDFQFRVVQQTGGMFWPMPNSLKSPDSEQ